MNRLTMLHALFLFLQVLSRLGRGSNIGRQPLLLLERHSWQGRERVKAAREVRGPGRELFEHSQLIDVDIDVEKKKRGCPLADLND